MSNTSALPLAQSRTSADREWSLLVSFGRRWLGERRWVTRLRWDQSGERRDGDIFGIEVEHDAESLSSIAWIGVSGVLEHYQSNIGVETSKCSSWPLLYGNILSHQINSSDSPFVSAKWRASKYLVITMYQSLEFSILNIFNDWTSVHPMSLKMCKSVDSTNHISKFMSALLCGLTKIEKRRGNLFHALPKPVANSSFSIRFVLTKWEAPIGPYNQIRSSHWSIWSKRNERWLMNCLQESWIDTLKEFSCKRIVFFSHRPNGFLEMSVNDMTILFLVILLDKTVSVG